MSCQSKFLCSLCSLCTGPLPLPTGTGTTPRTVFAQWGPPVGPCLSEKPSNPTIHPLSFLPLTQNGSSVSMMCENVLLVYVPNNKSFYQVSVSKDVYSWLLQGGIDPPKSEGPDHEYDKCSVPLTPCEFNQETRESLVVEPHYEHSPSFDYCYQFYPPLLIDTKS